MSDFIGRTIGEYQLVQLISDNEQSLLIKAFQPSQDRYVAVTLLKPHAARDIALVTRFLQSADFTTQMQHPNLLPVYESGQSDDRVYSVSAFMETGTLQENLNWFQNLNDILGLMSQITAGLEYIHMQGYIHGNLKSNNTFLDSQRRPLLSGIGVPQPPGGSPDPYSSPEQVEGGMVDKRSDVYALGVLLYELLTGGTPPAGIVASPRAKRPELPEAVDRVVLKAMAQNPDQRFQSAAEFRNALQNAIQVPSPRPVPQPVETPVTAPTVSQNVQVQQPKGTNWLAIVLGVLIVIICIGGAYLILPNILGGEEGTSPPTEPTAEFTPEEPTPEPLPTDTPLPTLPPEEPTQPLSPEQLPEEPGGQLPDICGSIGAVGLIAAMGIVGTYRKRKRGY